MKLKTGRFYSKYRKPEQQLLITDSIRFGMKNIGVTQISDEMLCRSSETFLSAVGVLLDSNQAIYLAWS